MPEEGEKLTSKIPIPSQDPEHDPNRDKDMFAGRFTDNVASTVQILTEEDKKLKETLDLLVSRVQEPADSKETQELQRQTLEALRKEIRSSTSSMTSVPKPLKFMRPHYAPLSKHYKSMPASDNKKLLADILSVLAMTMADETSRDSLHFKLEGHTAELDTWGHEYVRHLTTDIMNAFRELSDKGESVEHLLKLVSVIVPFNIKQNAPIDAIDLLTEVDRLSDLVPHIDADNYQRICYYLTSSAQTLNDAEEIRAVLDTAYQGYKKNNDLPQALRVAIRMDDQPRIVECFQAAKEDKPLSLQLGYILGSQKGRVEPDDVDGDEDILNAIGNVQLNSHYLQLAKELDVLAPKTPEDIYKTHLVEGSSFNRHRGAAAAGPTVDSAKQNLASTFVNAFVNAGFGKDTLVTPEGADWVFKNKAHGMLSAAASVGLIMLWDVETGFSAADKFTFSSQAMVKAGAQLATGILASGVTSEMDAVHGLLSEHLESSDVDTRLSAIMGLGIAYAGTSREDVLESLVPLIVDNSQPMEVVAITCLALGFIFVGTGHDDISGSILEGFLDRSETDLNDSVARMMCLGMGLLYLGRGENCESVLMAVKAIEHPIHQYLEATIETCAYVGSGNVLQIQKLLSMLNTHIEEDEKAPLNGIHQEIAVLGIAMVAMGEHIGAEMSLRMLDHVLQYGEVNVRRVVPLALGLLSVSNPRLAVMDTISKLSHDSDEQVSQNACLALGFLGAGTNNSRIANILRQLAAYYDKEPNHLFLIRIAQGLLHFGKGLVTLNPFHSDNFLLNKVGMAGLLAVFHSALDLKHSLLNKRHYLLYTLATAVRPRCLITVDEEGKALPVKVRVGQAVDVVAQVGNPKTITGFQTHTTPVLLAAGDRVELGTDQYIPLSSVLEGIVVLRKNPKASA